MKTPLNTTLLKPPCRQSKNRHTNFTHSATSSVIQAFNGLKVNIWVPEFIKETKGADIRCFVAGGKAIKARKRQGKDGEFRSNLHQGGTASLIRITAAERTTAAMAVSGADLLRSNHGSMVMEVNSSPSLEGIESASEKDIASMIIEFIENNAKKRVNRSRTKGKG